MNYKVLPVVYYAKDAEGIEPPEAEDAPELEAEEEAEPEAEKPNPDDEEEELEIEGRKAIVPKWMKPHVMMEKDYRHKTMEFGETKRDFEARVAAHEAKVKDDEKFVNLTRQFTTEVAKLEGVKSQIEHYEKRVDWAKWREQDPEQALQGNLEYQDLLRSRNMLSGALNDKLTAMQKRESDAAAKALDAFNRELPLKIKDWSPAKQAELKDRALKTYGLSEDDFAGVQDARSMQILHDAHMYHQLLAAKSKAPPVEHGKPVPKVKTVARADANEPSDRDDDKTWLQKRQAQIAARSKQLAGARR